MIWGSQLLIFLSLQVCCAVLIEASGGLTRRETKSEADGDAYVNYYGDTDYWDSNPDYSSIPNNPGPQIYSDFGYQDYPAVSNNPGPQIYSDFDYQDYSSVPFNQGPKISPDSYYQGYSSVSINQGPSFPSNFDYPNPVSPDNLANDQPLKVKSFVYFGSQAQNEKTKVKMTNQAKPKSQQDTNIGTALK